MSTTSFHVHLHVYTCAYEEVIIHHNQGHLQKEDFIWVQSSRGIRIYCGCKAWQEAAETNHSERDGGQGGDLSKPIPVTNFQSGATS